MQADICGGFRYHDYIGNKYFLTIIDRFSSYYDVIPLKNKSQATLELMNWIRRTENHFENNGGYKVSHVRTDNGGEFTNKILHDFFKERGITHELTVPYHSAQNGAVERAHGVLQNKVRSLLLGGRVPPYLWSEALLCAAYLHNRTPIIGRKRKIPYLYWNNKGTDRINISQLRVFGCAAYVNIPSDLRDGKFLPTSIMGVMVGYDSNRKAYRIYLPQQKKVITAKDVSFDENLFPLANTKESHDAYDFATGTLSGVPKYPTHDYRTHSTNSIIENQNVSNISSLPISFADHSQDVTAPTSAPLPTPTSSSTPLPSDSSNGYTTTTSISIDNDDPADLDYEPSITQNATSTTQVKEIVNPPVEDIDMPDYIPDQSDHIESNTQSILETTHNISKRQDELQSLINTLIENQQKQDTSQLEKLTQIMESMIQDRLDNSNLSVVQPPLEPTTVPATPTTPVVELPNSSPPPTQPHPTYHLPASSVSHALSLPSSVVSPTRENLVDSHLSTTVSESFTQEEVLPSSEKLALPSPSVSQAHSSSNTSVVPYHSSQALKRLHSDLSPKQGPLTTVSPDRGALILASDRHRNTVMDTPEPKRTHISGEENIEKALYGGLAYAIGDNPIPLFGFEHSIIPFGEKLNSQSYVVHSKDDSSFMRIHSAATALLAQTLPKTLPKTIMQARNSPYKKYWEEACEREMQALKKTKTYILVEMPKDRKVIPSKWVFTIKDNGLYKARIVVQGFRQVEGIDYQATFAPVIRYDSVRVFLALSAKFGLKVHQMDVVTAFLNSPIDTDIYVKPPPGFDTKPGFVWKLKSALYGLKQSPMLWNNHMKGTLSKLGFEQNKKEFGLFYRRSKGKLCLIALYVDDLLIASSSASEIHQIKTFLKKQYEMKDLGPVNKFLGMNIKQTQDYISISLVDYITKKAKEYNFDEIHPVYNPLQKHVDYYGDSPLLTNITAYQSLIGTLIFVANTVRLDIAHSVHFLSRFLQCPKEVHYKAAKRVFDYVYTTRDLGIKYTNAGPNKLIAYSDASYADCPDRKSTYGYVCMYASGPVTWCSKRIANIVTSSTEAETVAASEAAKEIKWLNQILSLMGVKSDTHLLHVDNTSSLKLADHPINHSNTKHIEVRHLFVREAAEMGLITPVYIKTSDQLADIFTKVLTKDQFTKLRQQIYNNNSTVDNLSTD